jgi:hypothetical protein
MFSTNLSKALLRSGSNVPRRSPLRLFHERFCTLLERFRPFCDLFKTRNAQKWSETFDKVHTVYGQRSETLAKSRSRYKIERSTVISFKIFRFHKK